MPCEGVGSGVIVCRHPYVRTAMHCDTCGRVRPMAGTYGLMYGYGLTYIGCGERWYDEGRGFRPPKRAWRIAAVRHALEIWPKAMPMRQEVDRQHAD